MATSKLTNRLIVGIPLVLFLSIMVWFGREMYYQVAYLHEIENIMGMRCESPYRDGKEVFEVSVSPNSLAAANGLQDKDIIASHTMGEFAKDFIDNPGGSFTMDVKRNGQTLQVTLSNLPQINP